MSFRIEARSTPSSNPVVLIPSVIVRLGCARAGLRLGMGVPDGELPVVFMVDRFSVVHVGAPEGALESLDVASSLSFLWTMASSEPFAVDLDAN